MKNSLKTVGITLIASLFEVVVGLGASLLASAALALGPSDALRSAKSASVQK